MQDAAVGPPPPVSLPHTRMPRMRSRLKAWLYANGFSVSDETQATHLMLNGGKVAVPRDRLAEMHAYMVADHRAGMPNFVVERRRPEPMPSRCVIDFDAETTDGTEVPDAEWQYLYACLRGVVHAAFPSHDASMVVLRAASKLKPNGKMKSGRHVVLPHLYVTSQIAKRIREAVISHVTASSQQWQLACPTLSDTPIDDVYDVSVMESNGIRMPMQHKAQACRKCNSRRQRAANAAAAEWRARSEAGLSTSAEPPALAYQHFRDCGDCHGDSYIYEGRPYAVYQCYDGDGCDETALLATLQADPEMLLRHTSVCGDDEDVAAASTVPVPGTLPELTEQVKRRDARRHTRNGAASTATSSNAATTGASPVVIERSHPAWSKVDEFIRDEFQFKLSDGSGGVDYGVLHALSRLRMTADGNVVLADSVTRACLNKARAEPHDVEHSHSRVYFTIERSTGCVRQRCHCLKTYNGVKCSRFSSDSKYLSRDVIKLLWPQDYAGSDAGDAGDCGFAWDIDVAFGGGAASSASSSSSTVDSYVRRTKRRIVQLRRIANAAQLFAAAPRLSARDRKRAYEAMMAKRKKSAASDAASEAVAVIEAAEPAALFGHGDSFEAPRRGGDV